MKLDEERLQDYIDDRLDERERAEFAAELLADPEAAEYADELRLQNEALKLVGVDVLDEKVPQRLTETVRRAGRRGGGGDEDGRMPKRVPAGILGGAFAGASALVNAAIIVAVFAAGGALGWWGHSQLNVQPSPDDIALRSGRDAYLLYAIENSFPVEFTQDRASELDDWVQRVFSVKVSPPDLGDYGYKYVGGRLLPRSDGNFGFYLFENTDRSRVAMVWWPRKSPPSAISSALKYQGVHARYWGSKGFGFALYGDEKNSEVEKLSERAYEFYKNLFDGD